MPRKKRGRPKSKAIIRYRKSKPTVKYRTRYVPKTARRKTKRESTFARVAKTSVALTCGMLTAKFVAKKFAAGGGEKEDWSWANYAIGAAGASLGGFAVSKLFKSRRAGEWFTLGGLGLVGYKIFTLEIAPKSQYLESWFGQDEDIYPEMSGYGRNSGDIWDGGRSQYVQGADGAWRPVDESHRMVGAEVVPASARFGADIVPADPSFGAEFEPADPSFGVSLEDQYNAAYQ